VFYFRYIIYYLTLGLSVSLRYRFSNKSYIDLYPGLSSQFTDNVTFIVSTFNESDRIISFLFSLPKNCNVLLIDNFSTDDTCKKALESFPNLRVEYIKNPGYVDKHTIKKILEHVDTEWCLFLAVSEYLPHKLLLKLDYLLNKNIYSAIFIPRKSITDGFLTHLTCEQIPFFISKLFKLDRKHLSFKLLKKSSWDFTASKIHHEFPVLKPTKKYILSPTFDNCIIHYRNGNFSVESNKLNSYLSYETSTNSFKIFHSRLVSFVKFSVFGLVCLFLSFTFSRVSLRSYFFQLKYRLTLIFR